MMGVWQPMTNLRDYVSQNPPGVTFFLCLLSLAVSFICISSYSFTNDLPNPDTATDWNRLLSSLSQFQLCVKANTSSSEPVSPVSPVSPVPSPLTDRDTSVDPTMSPPVTSLRLKVPLTVTTSSDSSSLKDLGLHTTMRAKQLNLGGDELVNLALELSGNDTYACLTISAPTHVLPMTLIPPKCPATEKNILPNHVEASNQAPTKSLTCYSLRSKTDPKLTVMLTKEEQSVAVRHLLEVSVCLLGVCVILCVVACLTQSAIRRYNWNGLDLQNEPLMDS